MGRKFTEAEAGEVWERRQSGESAVYWPAAGSVAGSVRAFVESSGGVRPRVRHRSLGHLSLTEREEIRSRTFGSGRDHLLVAVDAHAIPLADAFDIHLRKPVSVSRHPSIIDPRRGT